MGTHSHAIAIAARHTMHKFACSYRHQLVFSLKVKCTRLRSGYWWGCRSNLKATVIISQNQCWHLFLCGTARAVQRLATYVRIHVYGIQLLKLERAAQQHAAESPPHQKGRSVARIARTLMCRPKPIMRIMPSCRRLEESSSTNERGIPVYCSAHERIY